MYSYKTPKLYYNDIIEAEIKGKGLPIDDHISFAIMYDSIAWAAKHSR